MSSSNPTRPWHGMVLFIMYIIGAIFSGLAALVLLLLGPVMLGLSGDQELVQELNQEFAAEIGSADLGIDLPADMGSMLQLGGFIILGIGIFFLAIMVLDILLAIGYFRGWRWVPIVSLVFIALGAVLNLFSMFEGDIGSGVFGIAFCALMAWLAWTCYEHPFYQQQHIATKKPVAKKKAVPTKKKRVK